MRILVKIIYNKSNYTDVDLHLLIFLEKLLLKLEMKKTNQKPERILNNADIH